MKGGLAGRQKARAQPYRHGGESSKEWYILPSQQPDARTHAYLRCLLEAEQHRKVVPHLQKTAYYTCILSGEEPDEQALWARRRPAPMSSAAFLDDDWAVPASQAPRAKRHAGERVTRQREVELLELASADVNTDRVSEARAREIDVEDVSDQETGSEDGESDAEAKECFSEQVATKSEETAPDGRKMPKLELTMEAPKEHRLAMEAPTEHQLASAKGQPHRRATSRLLLPPRPPRANPPPRPPRAVFLQNQRSPRRASI